MAEAPHLAGSSAVSSSGRNERPGAHYNGEADSKRREAGL